MGSVASSKKVAQTFSLCFVGRTNCVGVNEHRLKSVLLLQHPGEFFEIVDKATMFQAAGFIIRRAQN